MLFASFLFNIKKSKHLVKEGNWVKAVWPAAININGSVPTPYIFDDRVNNKDVALAIGEMYSAGKENRKKWGLEGREFMMNNLSNKIMCDKMYEGITTAIENFKPKKRFNLYKVR